MLERGLKRFIEVTTHFEGVHCYPQADTSESYLREPHRHIFKVCVKMSVYHNDREVEFIALKHCINEWLRAHTEKNGVWMMHTMSCEQVAEELLAMLDKQYCTRIARHLSVGVYEDDENGAIVEGDYNGL